MREMPIPAAPWQKPILAKTILHNLALMDVPLTTLTARPSARLVTPTTATTERRLLFRVMLAAPPITPTALPNVPTGAVTPVTQNREVPVFSNAITPIHAPRNMLWRHVLQDIQQQLALPVV